MFASRVWTPDDDDDDEGVKENGSIAPSRAVLLVYDGATPSLAARVLLASAEESATGAYIDKDVA